jgi:hypothetical protein
MIKTAHNKKDSYILSYKFQRKDSQNTTVFFYSGMTIGLLKYYFQPCKLRDFVFQKGFVC